MPPTQRLPITRPRLAKSLRTVLTTTAGQVAKIGRPRSLCQSSQINLFTVLVSTGLSPLDNLLFGTSSLSILGK